MMPVVLVLVSWSRCWICWLQWPGMGPGILVLVRALVTGGSDGSGWLWSWYVGPGMVPVVLVLVVVPVLVRVLFLYPVFWRFRWS